MSKFLFRSLLVLFVLYGVLFAFGDYVLVRVGASAWIAVAFVLAFAVLQFVASPWIIGKLLDIRWYAEEDMPKECVAFVNELCARRGLRRMQIGIIESETPNAFSYGRFRRDARVVITRGLLDVLTPEEVNAVLAHEIGHIEHYDFAVMTAASVVPMLLYQVYVFTRSNRNAGLVAWGAYLAYIVSQYVVLTLNRVREYWADHYCAEVTHQPEVLASALVKIGYGLVRAEGEYRRAMQKNSGEDKKWARKQWRIGRTTSMMGIANVGSSEALALSSTPGEASRVMEWDLVNPWARFYELNSTHPLTALRVQALNEAAEEMHLPVQYPLPRVEGRSWGRFPVEFVLWAEPWVLGFSILAGYRLRFERELIPALITLFGISLLVKILFRYRGNPEPATVAELLSDTTVSQMRPRATRMQVTVLGQGVPGAFWSADLVVRDESGMMFLLYRQTMPFARLWFALTSVQDLVGRQATVEGWYRRGVKPYVEMWRLTTEDGKTHTTYSRWIQLALSAAIFALGVALMVAR